MSDKTHTPGAELVTPHGETVGSAALNDAAPYLLDAIRPLVAIVYGSRVERLASKTGRGLVASPTLGSKEQSYERQARTSDAGAGQGGI